MGPLAGIIAFLTRECGGNVHDKGMVLAIADCQPRPQAPAKCIADFDHRETRFVSEHSWEGWVGYDFITSSVLPTHYSLQSQLVPHLRAWVLEGTIDGINWFLLDSKQDSAVIDGEYKADTFEVAYPRVCWKVRVKQAGPTKNEGTYPRDFFALSAFELFGTFYPGNPP
jgi:hypothetical protein